jgi:ABC-2 type transport system permease protein
MPEGCMNIKNIARLVRKDCWLMRWPLAAYILAAIAGLAMTLSGGSVARSAGITLAFNVLIGVSFHVMLGPVLGERERKTLAFVMSLPVTPRDAAVAKLAAAFTLFLIPATIAATTLVWLSPIDIPAAMAAAHRPLWSHLLGMLGYYALVLGAWMVFFSLVLGAAIISESVGWTIGVLTGVLFVFGNFVIQILPILHGLRPYMRALARGQAALPITIACEAAGIAAIVAIILMLQQRKTSFV